MSDYTTVGDLVAFLLTLDQDMPILHRGTMGNFADGMSFAQGEFMRNKREPEYIAHVEDKVWKTRTQDFDAPFTALTQF